MNKSELIAAVSENAGLTKKDTERVINACLDSITAALCKGDKVQISGFGTFEVKDPSRVRSSGQDRCRRWRHGLYGMGEYRQ